MSQPTDPGNETNDQPSTASAPSGPTLYISQSSHLDWDWILPFPILVNNTPGVYYVNYFACPEDIGGQHPVSKIFDMAVKYLFPNGTFDPNYFYSICEMGFLQAFMEQYPDQFNLFTKAGNNLRIVGGGITSPDNLLPHGEAFIRNYLVGKLWMDSVLNLPMRQAWLPDDFGHDPQLPVMLEAMGFQGVSFARVPGDAHYSLSPVDGSPSVANWLKQNQAVDFIWQAADGSTTYAHWLLAWYNQGDNIWEDPIGNIQTYISSYHNSENQQAYMPTPYMFVPVGDDFSVPKDLPSFVSQWNNQSTPPSIQATASTFDDFVQALIDYNAAYPGVIKQFTLRATPYHTGCYATRPLLKRMHYEATKALLAAEIFSLLSANLSPSTASETATALANGWNNLAPSTHHDYITGTAVSPVYYGEQIPLSTTTLIAAESLRDDVFREVAGAITATPACVTNECDDSCISEIPVAVFNQLGFSQTGPVELSPSSELCYMGSDTASIRTGAQYFPVQINKDGGVLFIGTADSLGYSTYYLSANPPNQSLDPNLSITSPDGQLVDGADQYLLQNSLLKATISLNLSDGLPANYGITSLIDINDDDKELIADDAIANQLAIYQDGGENYNFGNETSGTNTLVLVANPSFTNLSAQVIETGPVRVRLQTQATYTDQQTGAQYIYTREYMLVANEPFLRMRTTGAAPYRPNAAQPSSGLGFSVMVEFPLAGPINYFAHGTTYHWDDTPQVRYWAEGPAFEAAHDYLLVGTGESWLGAIFHGSVPAWGQYPAVDGQASNTLVGCLLRNTNGTNFRGYDLENLIPPNGIDPQSHTLEYTFRVPTGIQAADTGTQLREAMSYHTPLRAVAIPTDSTQKLPDSFSLASVSTEGTTPELVIITAAKAGSYNPDGVVIRLYQPANNSQPISGTLYLDGLASLGSGNYQVVPVTALEAAIENAQNLPQSNGGYSLSLTRALTTLMATRS